MKNWRFYTLVFFVLLCFALVVSRLFFLQVIKHSYYKALAQTQHQLFTDIIPVRGEIFLKDKNISGESSLVRLAINRDFYTVYAVPDEVKDKEETVSELSPFLQISPGELQEKINKAGDPYEALQSKVSEDTADKIKNLNLAGIHFQAESWRYYPNNGLASQVLGFLGYDGDKKVGRYGIEGYFENELAGRPGVAQAKKDNSGELISIGDNIIKQPEDGADIILTIDPNVEFFVEEKLKSLVEGLKGTEGTIIIMETKTGAIRAMANWPNFDPNKYNEVKNATIFLNSAVSDVFEPGSIFKPITMASAIDAGAITPNTTYEDKGYAVVSGVVIKNAINEANGIQTMTQVIEKSLNSGAIFAQQALGKDGFEKYIKKFGFGEKTGIDLGGEESGNISNLAKKNDVDFATMSFGQGIAVTPIQLIAAMGAIANDGILLQPHVVERIKYKNGQEDVTKTKEVRRVISSDTASRVAAMMVSSVKNGYSKKGAIEGYSIAGKTGTAQVPDPDTGEYSAETIHTFMEFFPAFDSQFVMLIKVDKPQTKQFSSETIVPTARQIAEYILNYYEIPPSQ